MGWPSYTAKMAAGTVIPDQDASILGGSPQQPPVAVANNVEQPAELSAPANVPEAQANPPRAIAGLATGAASVPVPAPPAQAQPQPSAEPQSIADLIEPKKVKTVLVRPDGTLLPNDAPPQVTAAAVPVLAARPIATYIAKALTPKSAAHVATTPSRPRSMRMAIRGREPPLPPRPSGWSLPTRGNRPQPPQRRRRHQVVSSKRRVKRRSGSCKSLPPNWRPRRFLLPSQHRRLSD